MKDTRLIVAELRRKDPNIPATKIARDAGVSRERVRQILNELGLPTRVKRPSIDNRPEYKCWHNMIRRCVDPACSSFRYYGARGIKVCKKWLVSFDAFYADMGPRPSKVHSIERKNSDGDYEPRNCMWATKAQQVASMRKVAKSGRAPWKVIAEALRSQGTVDDAVAYINSLGHETPINRIWLYREAQRRGTTIKALRLKRSRPSK